jgi:hypothetical protein
VKRWAFLFLLAALLTALLTTRSAIAAVPGYSIHGDPGSWPTLLSSIGFQPATGAASLTVITDDGGSQDWPSAASAGAFLIIQGTSAAAQQFGITATGDSVSVQREQDMLQQDLTVVWAKPIAIPKVTLPAGATVYARDKWSQIPLVAGIKTGGGYVLWVAGDPGPTSYDRYPCLLQTLQTAGLRFPLRSKQMALFFDYGYRSEVDLDYFAAKWRADGVGTLFVSSWYFFDSAPNTDAYLAHLIQACHKNGILVYAWLELPHVSQQLWDAHPEWREKTALLQDAAIYWRLNMNLLDPDCSAAVTAGILSLLNRFDWDGVNLAELYFENPVGLGDPAEFTPMNGLVRSQVESAYGFDPVKLFDPNSPLFWTNSPPELRAFLDYRAGLQLQLHQYWIETLIGARAQKPDLDVLVTYLDDLSVPSMHDLIGADAHRFLPLMDQYDFRVMVEDASALWSLGPSRYQVIAGLYAAATTHTDRLAIDINIVSRPLLAYPTEIQTGAEFSGLVHTAGGSFPQLGLYVESSILDPDIQLMSYELPNAAVQSGGDQTTVASAGGVGIAWDGPANLDGQPWPFIAGGYAWIPAGTHTLTAAPAPSPFQILDFNGGLTALQPGDGRLTLQYSSFARSFVKLDSTPDAISIDGAAIPPASALWLPRGTHTVSFGAK